MDPHMEEAMESMDEKNTKLQPLVDLEFCASARNARIL